MPIVRPQRHHESIVRMGRISDVDRIRKTLMFEGIWLSTPYLPQQRPAEIVLLSGKFLIFFRLATSGLQQIGNILGARHSWTPSQFKVPQLGLGILFSHLLQFVTTGENSMGFPYRLPFFRETSISRSPSLAKKTVPDV